MARDLSLILWEKNQLRNIFFISSNNNAFYIMINNKIKGLMKRVSKPLNHAQSTILGFMKNHQIYIARLIIRFVVLSK